MTLFTDLGRQRKLRLALLLCAAVMSLAATSAAPALAAAQTFPEKISKTLAISAALFRNEIQFQQWTREQALLDARPPSFSPRDYAKFLANQYGQAWQAEGHNHSGMEALLSDRVEQETGYPINSHEAGEGPNLKPDLDEHSQTWLAAETCPAGVPVKRYEVVAIRVNMVLNR